MKTTGGSTKGATDLEDLDQVFHALAHPSRRHILLVIKFRGSHMRAGEIASRFSCTWPTITRHLRVLEEAELVTVERQGRERVYALDEERLKRIVGGWLDWFEDTPDERPPDRQGGTP